MLRFDAKFEDTCTDHTALIITMTEGFRAVNDEVMILNVGT